MNQGIGLCFHDFDLGDLRETTRTNNQESPSLFTISATGNDEEAAHTRKWQDVAKGQILHSGFHVNRFVQFKTRFDFQMGFLNPSSLIPWTNAFPFQAPKRNYCRVIKSKKKGTMV
ncbi:hypothetical protein P8452_53403 [Trifolium repens]|nr:hypothetical protein P8452_53403 [Trifolium repens]